MHVHVPCNRNKYLLKVPRYRSQGNTDTDTDTDISMFFCFFSSGITCMYHKAFVGQDSVVYSKLWPPPPGQWRRPVLNTTKKVL